MFWRSEGSWLGPAIWFFFIFYLFRPKLLRVFSFQHLERRHRMSPQICLIALLGVILTAITWNYYAPLFYFEFLFFSSLVGAVFAHWYLKIWPSRRWLVPRMYLDLFAHLSIPFAAAISLLMLFNAGFSSKEFLTIEAPIMEKWVGRKKVCHLKIEVQQGGWVQNTATLWADCELYRQAKIGQDHLQLLTRKGGLGFLWIVNDADMALLPAVKNRLE